MPYSYEELKKRQRAERENHPENIGIRIHRALSWLDRAEQCEDEDGRFIFLWISFNAAYANDLSDMDQMAETLVFNQFLKRLVDLDKDKVLYNLIWSEFAGSIRLLLNNEYVFAPFWDFQRGKITENRWKAKFTTARRKANAALGKKQTTEVLAIIFSRLYMLRNQLVHGGATWDSSVNRNQLRDGANFLAKVVPLVIEILLDHPVEVWGDAMYPVVD